MHIFLQKKNVHSLNPLRSQQNIELTISGLRVQCRVPAHTYSSFLANTSVRNLEEPSMN